jgi:hypothetical protein
VHGCCLQLLAFAVNQAVYASGLQSGWRLSFAAVAWCPLVILLLLGTVLPGAYVAHTLRQIDAGQVLISQVAAALCISPLACKHTQLASTQAG